MSRHCSLEMLSSFVDRELDKGDRERVQDHLSGCSSCRDRLAGLEQVVRQLQRLEAVAPPPTLGIRLERRIGLERGKQRIATLLEKEAGKWLRQPVLAPVFAIVLALGIIVYLFAVGVWHQRVATTQLVIPKGAEEISPDRAKREVSEAPEQRRRSLAASPEPPRSEAVRTVVLSGRTFDLKGGIWRERSLPSRAPEETVDLRQGGPDLFDLPPELEELRVLEGRVHLLLEGRVVELILPGEQGAP